MDNLVAERIRQEIDGNDVVLFMKGTPVFPQCGFSAAARFGVFRRYEGIISRGC